LSLLVTPSDGCTAASLAGSCHSGTVPLRFIHRYSAEIDRQGITPAAKV